MRILLFYFGAFFLMSQAKGQTTELYITSGSSFFISSGETVQVNKLTLIPSASFELDKSIKSHTSLINNTSGITQSYLGIVYAFDATTAAYSGTIKINHSGASNTGNIAESAMRLHYHDGARWNIDASSSSTGSLLTSSALSSKTLNELTIAGSTYTLPVTWLAFTAEKKESSSLLKWSTATEQNTKEFEVQHSINTVSWISLGTVAAAGNSTTVRQYSFTHNTPLKGGVYNYYRILQRDVDGKTSYSKIASLIYNEPGADLIVYPNPATESATIYLADPNEVKLINIAGAIVWRSVLSAGRNQVDLSRFAKGVYWVVVGGVSKQLLIQ